MFFLDKASSLKSRLILGILVMLLPLSLLVAGSFIAIRGAVGTLEEAVSEPLDRLLFITDIQKLFHKMKTPLQQYAVRMEESTRSRIESLNIEIGLAFDAGFASDQLSEREQELLTTAKHGWINLQVLVGRLFEQGKSLGKSGREQFMLQVGRELDRTIYVLEELESLALNNVQRQRLEIQGVKWQALIMALVVVVVGLAFAFLGSLLLFRSVVSPIQRLERSVERFGQGDLSSRITLDTNDELGHLASAFNAMAERFQNIQTELDYMSIYDSLTGLYDRPQFHDMVGLEVKRSKRYQRPFSLLFLDIDNFRSVNETYGRLVGDSVLCSVAMQIKNNIRPTDTAARYDGDSFAVILSETGHEGATQAARRLQEHIANNPLNIGDGKTLHISVSVGIATYPDDGDSETALFAQTEYALELAKQDRLGDKQHQSG